MKLIFYEIDFFMKLKVPIYPYFLYIYIYLYIYVYMLFLEIYLSELGIIFPIFFFLFICSLSIISIRLIRSSDNFELNLGLKFLNISMELE